MVRFGARPWNTHKRLTIIQFDIKRLEMVSSKMSNRKIPICVQAERLELSQLAALDPKSSVHLPKQHQSHSFSIDYIICHFLWYHLISIDFNICCTYVVPRETNKFVSLGKLLGKLNIQNWMLYLCCTWFGFRTQN